MVIQKNSAKAVILENEQVLMLKKQYEDGSTIYTLPGGTQELGEELHKAVVREVYEEVGAKVDVIDLVNVYEHKHQSRKDMSITKHKLEFAFLCRIVEPYKPQNGERPDPHQVAVEWIDINSLHNLDLTPSKLAKIISELTLAEKRIYLGNIG